MFYIEVCSHIFEIIEKALLYRNEILHIFNFSGTFPAFEYLFSAPQGLFISVVFSRFRVSAQRLEDSIPNTCARYWDSRPDIDKISLSRVLAQLVEISMILGYLEYLHS